MTRTNQNTLLGCHIHCGTCFHQWKKEDCDLWQTCNTFSSYKVDTARCEYCSNLSFRTILCDSCGKWHSGDNTEWGRCTNDDSRTNCKSTCKDFELARHYKKFDPTEDARCSFDDKAPPPAENKRLQEMDDEEEARAECYRLAQVRTGRDI